MTVMPAGRALSPGDVEPLATEARTTVDELQVDVADGRRIAVPLAWFPRLLHATAEQRGRFELIGDGEGIHWPDVDEDISVRGCSPDCRRSSTSAASVRGMIVDGDGDEERV